MPNWKKVIVSGSDAALNSLDVAGGITGSDVTIDDWGSISASLASINATGSTQNLQQVTDNGNTTTNDINVVGSITASTIESVTASIDYALINDRLQGNGPGFQFFAYNEDTAKVKFANWYSSNDRQYGMGQLWYETWFAAIDNQAGRDNRRIGFYLEEPNAGASDTSGSATAHPSNARFYVDINGGYLSGSLNTTGDITGSALQLGNLGAENEILIVGANTEVTSSDILAIDTINQRVGIGTSTPEVKLDIVGESSGEAQVRVAQHDNTSDGPDIRFFKSHGTAASSSAVANNDYIGAVNAFAYDGSDYIQSGFFGFQADGTDGDSKFGLRTRVSGTLADRIAIDAVGDVNIAENLTVTGDITGSDVTIDDWGSISASLASIDSSVTLQDATDNGNTTTNSITASAYSGSDITIDDWGSVSASLASINATSSAQNLQQVTDNGNTTTNAITASQFSGDEFNIKNSSSAQSTNFGYGSANNYGGTDVAGPTVLGYNALLNAQTFDGGVAIGHSAGKFLSSTLAQLHSNTFVGGYAARNGYEARSTTAIGTSALQNFSASLSNIAIGHNALVGSGGGDTGSAIINQTIAIGVSAGFHQSSPSNTVMLGNGAGNMYNWPGSGSVSDGSDNSIYIGHGALTKQKNRTNEIVIGYQATGSGNNSVTIGNSDTLNNYFFGNISGSDITIDDWGSISASLASIESGASSSNQNLQQVTDQGSTTTNEISTPNILINSSSANHIVKYGYQAASNASEDTNGGVVIGQLALSSSANSVSNTVVIGPQAMYNYTGGTIGNTVIGAQSALYLISGIDNTILGQGAVGGTQATASSYNTAIGGGSLAIVQGNYNTALGYGAGSQQSQGSGSIYIGKSAGIKNDGGSHGQHDSIYIGTSASPFNSTTPGGTANEIVIGAYQTGSGANTFNIQGKLRGNANGDITASGDFYTLGAITGSDVKINGWGSVSGSLASINTSLNPTLQQVTLNGSTTNQTITISSSVNLGLTTLGVGGIDLWAPSSGTSRVTMKAQSGSAVITEGEIYHQQDSLIPTNVWRAKNYNGGYENIVVQGNGDLDLWVPTGSSHTDYTQFSVRFYTSSLGDPREQFEIRHYPSDDSITASLQGMFTSSDAYIDNWGSISASLGSISSTLGPGTISGRALGSNLENLNADGTTLTFDVTSSAYNGSTELTLSAITGSVASGSTALATGDQIVSYVNSITTGLDLQGVTNNGATTTNPIIISGSNASLTLTGSNTIETDYSTVFSSKKTCPDSNITTLFSASILTYVGAVVNYTLYDAGKNNMRTGTVTAVSNATATRLSEVVTTDIGDTSDLEIGVVLVSPGFGMRVTNNSGASFNAVYSVTLLKE